MFKVASHKIFTAGLWLASLLLSSSIYAASLSDMAGNSHTLDEYVGNDRWLVVMIWASDCHVCNQEAHGYALFHDKHKEKDASVLGISMDGADGKADAVAFIERHRVTFPNLIGGFEDIAEMFVELTGENWIGTPTFLFYNPAGELVAQQVGAVPVDMIENFIKSNS
ncbi:MAG: redoxin domain-containing protein [Gammaproteobacteria bacterium]|nr:redoxin domain-containing protein [Gammaproteobacteria bacterium]